jgi:threonine dehydrogenase-like Zn-dependent dehydrogenase
LEVIARFGGVEAFLAAATEFGGAVELAGVIARDRARVVATGAVGLKIPRKLYYEKELSLVNSRSYGPGRYDPSYEESGADYPIGYVRWTEGRNLEAVLGLMAGGKLQVAPLITHRIPIERGPEAYEIITGKKKEPFLGVLLTYPLEESSASTLIEFHQGGNGDVVKWGCSGQETSRMPLSCRR